MNPTFILGVNNKKPKSASELEDQLAIPIEIGNVGDTANSIGSYYSAKENIGANNIGSSSSNINADRRFSGFGVSSASPWGAFGEYGNKLHWRKKRQTFPRKKRQTLPESPLFSKIWPTLYTNGKVTFGTNWKNNIFGTWVPDETDFY